MARVATMRNIMMELRKTCQSAFVSAPELENMSLEGEAAQKALVESSGKLAFLKLLLPKLKERGHRVLLFSQFKIALDRIEDFLFNDGYNFLRLDGDVAQAVRQKQMDAFNAPDSDVFIFMLTTRAGGVGINLASADTVIIFDPDFNPHQDHQAIARAHRYGQTKPVLVFRLMMKNSVEEKIVHDGKKKMVLDHLVVQQMGKENEEGDIDHMLLHGAAALYDTNPDGTAASDIKYSSKDVDELIDKVEADAVAEAKALAERDRLKAEGGEEKEGTPGTEAKKKESMSFAFAKIWEADANRLHEMSDDESEDDEQDQATEWQEVLARVEKARQAAILAEMENGQRARRQAAAAISANKAAYRPLKLDYGSDDSQTRKKKGKKAKAGQNSDGEFALDPDAEGESESDSGHEGVADDSDMLEIQKMQKALDKTTVPLPKTTGKVGRPPKNPKVPKSGQATPAQGSTSPKHPSRPKSSQSQRGRPPAPRTDSEIKMYQAAQLAHLGPVRIKAAQDVAQWLFHVLSNLNLRNELDLWALMALPELQAKERVGYYHQLAKIADEEMVRRGQVNYFTTKQVIDTVLPLLQNGGQVLPDDFATLPYPVKTQLGTRMGQASTQPGNASAVPVTNGGHGFIPSNGEASGKGSAAAGQPIVPPHELCEYCSSSSHTLVDCGEVPELHSLERTRADIIKRQADPSQIYDGLDGYIDLARKREALRASPAISGAKAQRMAAAGAAVDSQAIEAYQRYHKRKVAAEEAAASHAASQRAIQQTEAPPAKRPKTDASGTGPGCDICKGRDLHDLRICPVVIKGPESIKAALKDHPTTSSTWLTLKSLYDHLVPDPTTIGTPVKACAFCGLACGKTVRACATFQAGGSDAAGRKLLKGKIRAAEGTEDPSMDELFDVYLKWEK